MSGVAGRYGGVPDDVPMRDVAAEPAARQKRKPHESKTKRAAAAAATAGAAATFAPLKTRKVSLSKSRKTKEEGDVVTAGVGRELRKHMESVAGVVKTVSRYIGAVGGPRTLVAAVGIPGFLLGFRAISEGATLSGAAAIGTTAILAHQIAQNMLTTSQSRESTGHKRRFSGV